MDINKMRNIQFLDLTGVDESEKRLVLSSLDYYGPQVQLPWIKKQKNYTDVKSLNTPSESIQNHQYHPNALANHAKPPLINPSATPCVFSSSSYIPNHLANFSVTASTSTPTVNGSAVNTQNSEHVKSFIESKHELARQGIKFNEISHEYEPEDIVVMQASGPSRQNGYCIPHNTTSQADFTRRVLAAGPPQPSEVVSPSLASSSACPSQTSPKSWASLFNKGGANKDQNGNGVVKTVSNQAVNKESNNNNNVGETLCPIKYPRSGRLIDPDCYRMGEFLASYTVDCRTISLLPRGLINRSNYCYINSILQALMACPPMYNFLESLSKNITIKETKRQTPVINGLCRFVKEFQHLTAAQRVRRTSDKSQKNDQVAAINYDPPFEPLWIYEMLNGITSDLIQGRQEDAEEFLGCLLNGLNDEMLEVKKLLNNDVNSEEAEDVIENKDELDSEWQVMGPKKKSSVTRRTEFVRTPISDIFGGFLKSRIHRAGDQCTENIQPFFTLQLNIDKVNTVNEALEALVTKNQLEGVTSSKTNEEVEAWQQVLLDELPLVLILHLKCFNFRLDGCKKIIKSLQFPIDLRIDPKLISSKIAKEKQQYKLFAVVYHDGKEVSKGHYVTDAFHVGYSSWLRFDDSSVKAVEEDLVLNPVGNRVPYLLFYRRSDTIRGK